MREVQSSLAKTHLPQLLDAVEKGESIVITRHGRAIARLVPEEDVERAKARRAIAAIEAVRQRMPKLTLEDILDGRHDGHKY